MTASFPSFPRLALSAACLALTSSAAVFNAYAEGHAPDAYPDASASDPVRVGWMIGSPPPADRIVRFDDGSYFRFPALR